MILGSFFVAKRDLLLQILVTFLVPTAVVLTASIIKLDREIWFHDISSWQKRDSVVELKTEKPPSRFYEHL